LVYDRAASGTMPRWMTARRPADLREERNIIALPIRHTYKVIWVARPRLADAERVLVAVGAAGNDRGERKTPLPARSMDTHGPPGPRWSSLLTCPAKRLSR